jgi:hypothetical protein
MRQARGESSVESSDAKLEAPKNTSIKGPAYDLNLGSPDTIVVFLSVHIDVGAFFVGHVTIRKALEFRSDKVRSYCLGSEYELEWSVRIGILERCAMVTYTSKWHQVIVQLPSRKPNLSRPHYHSHPDSEKTQGE